MATVREIQPDELDELLELYRMLHPDDPPLERCEHVEAVWAELCEDESVTIVAVEHESRIVSSCLLSITPNLTRNARPFAVIENVVTHTAYRGQGFGKRCVRDAVDRAAAAGCYKVMLQTGTERDWKLEFYEACGFDGGEKTGFVRYLDG